MHSALNYMTAASAALPAANKAEAVSSAIAANFFILFIFGILSRKVWK